ncbi:GSCOCG00010690001-RA-CDS, partial [Cotesia congregata]
MRHKILPYMKLTEHVKLIRYDLLIILFGNEECTKYRKRNLAQMIRAKLSLIARFLLFIKKIEVSITDFASIYDPKHY